MNINNIATRLETICCKLMLRNLDGCYRYNEDSTDYERCTGTQKRIIGSWIADSPDEGWNGLPDAVALQHIQVMDSTPVRHKTGSTSIAHDKCSGITAAKPNFG